MACFCAEEQTTIQCTVLMPQTAKFSGRILQNTDGYFATGPAIAYGNVYELNKDGNLYAIDLATGQLVWKYQGPGTLLWPGYPTVADGKVYATTGEIAQYGGPVGTSEFVCLNAYTGAGYLETSHRSFSSKRISCSSVWTSIL